MSDPVLCIGGPLDHARKSYPGSSHLMCQTLEETLPLGALDFDKINEATYRQWGYRYETLIVDGKRYQLAILEGMSNQEAYDRLLDYYAAGHDPKRNWIEDKAQRRIIEKIRKMQPDELDEINRLLFPGEPSLGGGLANW